MTHTPPTMTLPEAAVEVAKQAKRTEAHKIAAIAGRVAIGGGNGQERDLIGRLAVEWQIASVDGQSALDGAVLAHYRYLLASAPRLLTTELKADAQRILALRR